MLRTEDKLVGRVAMLFKRSSLGVPVHFLHIGKTGGTAITEALRPIAQGNGIVLHTHATRLSDIPRDQLVFFFVRHPISRFVSGFYSRLRRGAPRYYYKWSAAEAEAFGRFQKANDLAEALSTADHGTLTQAREAMRCIQHVNSPYRNWFSGEQELDERLDSILLLGLQEKLIEDFERLKVLLNLPPALSLPNDDVLAHRNPADIDRRLTSVAERNLFEWYAEDIRFYERCVQFRARQTLSVSAATDEPVFSRSPTVGHGDC
jgi:hypothetical protein